MTPNDETNIRKMFRRSFNSLMSLTPSNLEHKKETMILLAEEVVIKTLKESLTESELFHYNEIIKHSLLINEDKYNKLNKEIFLKVSNAIKCL